MVAIYCKKKITSADQRIVFALLCGAPGHGTLLSSHCSFVVPMILAPAHKKEHPVLEDKAHVGPIVEEV